MGGVVIAEGLLREALEMIEGDGWGARLPVGGLLACLALGHGGSFGMKWVAVNDALAAVREVAQHVGLDPDGDRMEPGRRVGRWCVRAALADVVSLGE